ncbi:hypothetical protein PAEPH01_0898 [Pancytospora epiphaga]|nr:hypothetical protein PAEPH01_0898 [Pancytospora epiphaga]
MFFGRYKITCVVLSMRMHLASSDVPNHSNLKRKLEENSFEMCKTKRYGLDIAVLNRYLEKYVFEDKINEGYADNKEDKGEKQVPEKVNDKKNLIVNNPQICIKIPKIPENELLNGQVELLSKEGPSGISNKVKMLPDFKKKSKKDPLVTTTERNEIKDNYDSLMQQKLNDTKVYSYSNSMFLNNFLKFPSPIFTADSIRVRFGSGFLNFLSTDQLIRVLATLLSRDLELTSAERTELVETIFGHVDFSLEMKFNNDQIISIVTALLRSDVPYCFEQVFLTWKMWKVFTIEEQEQMLKGVIKQMYRMKYARETLVMLYLFVLNRDATNSSKCEIFKECIVKIYGKSCILNHNDAFNPFKYIKCNFLAANTFDNSLLDLPNVLKNLSDSMSIKFKNYIKQDLCYKRGYSYSLYFGSRYKIHIYYALTKFTRNNSLNNDEGAIDIYDEVYFYPEHIRYVLNKWSITSKKNYLSVDELEINEFRNAYGAMRQIVQSEKYNSTVFLRLFFMINTTDTYNRMFTFLLFSLTKENILRDVKKTPEWTEHEKSKCEKKHGFIYIENIFLCNSYQHVPSLKGCLPIVYHKRITSIMHKLITVEKRMYREHYSYKYLLFHPKFEIFNNYLMAEYIEGLNEIGQLDSKEKRLQIVRDLLFSRYYYESAEKLELGEAEGTLKEFEICLKEEREHYKNKIDIEKEREIFEIC